MKAIAIDRGVLAFRWHGGDSRGYVPPRGYTAQADLIDHHPLTGKFLGRSEWWVFLTVR